MVAVVDKENASDSFLYTVTGKSFQWLLKAHCCCFKIHFFFYECLFYLELLWVFAGRDVHNTTQHNSFPKAQILVEFHLDFLFDIIPLVCLWSLCCCVAVPQRYLPHTEGSSCTDGSHGSVWGPCEAEFPSGGPDRRWGGHLFARVTALYAASVVEIALRLCSEQRPTNCLLH